MAALSERKLDIVRGLVETAPDRVVGGLHAALAEAGGDSALASVRRLVEAEARDRRLRNIVLLPIAPLCVGDGRDPTRLIFPGKVLGLLWRGLKVSAPAAIAAAELALYDYRPGETAAEPFDRLIGLAARGFRCCELPEFQAVAEACEEARAGGASALLTCLDVSEVVRRVAHRLPEWTHSPQGEDASVGARLAYRDAVAISEDSGPLFFEMLAALLPHPWMILRIISAVMDKPTERYLADSEMAFFGERILRDIESALMAIAEMDLDAGPAAAALAARQVDDITLQATELETCVTLTRTSGWGVELGKHRRALANLVEAWFRQAEKCFAQALPTSRARLKRIRRGVPRLSGAPDAAAVGRCLTLLTFIRDVRLSANYGGFAAARAKTLETLADLLDHYVEELLDLVKTGDAENEANARAFLAVAAEFSGLLRDEKAADLVRRRAAAARQRAPETAPAAET